MLFYECQLIGCIDGEGWEQYMEIDDEFELDL